MPLQAITQSSDSQNPPLFAVYDSITRTWYHLDPEAWSDLALQGNDPDEFAFFCEDCLKLLSLCDCPPFEELPS